MFKQNLLEIYHIDKLLDGIETYIISSMNKNIYYNYLLLYPERHEEEAIILSLKKQEEFLNYILSHNSKVKEIQPEERKYDQVFNTFIKAIANMDEKKDWHTNDGTNNVNKKIYYYRTPGNDRNRLAHMIYDNEIDSSNRTLNQKNYFVILRNYDISKKRHGK